MVNNTVPEAKSVKQVQTVKSWPKITQLGSGQSGLKSRPVSLQMPLLNVRDAAIINSHSFRILISLIGAVAT